MSALAASLPGLVAAPVSAASFAVSVSVSVIPARVDFDIPADRLDRVLIAIAKSVGGIILFDPALTGALKSAGVKGRFTVQEALREAMNGTDLEAAANPDGSFGVHRVAGKAAAAAPSASAADMHTAADAAAGIDPSVLPAVVVSNDRDAETSHGYNDIGFVTRTTRSATRTDTPLSEIPQSIQGVTTDLIEGQQAQSVVDALRNVSSVSFERGSGVDQAGVLYVRGFVAPVMKNGVADLISLTNVTSGRVAGSRSITSLDTPIAAIERVEVLGGADSIIAGGPMEPGGVVNILTKRPQADTVREATLEIGNDGHRRIALDLAGSLSADQIWTYRTIVSATHDARTFDGYDGAREFYLAPSIGYKHDGTSVVAGASHHIARSPFGGYQNAQLGDQGLGPDLRTSPWGRADDHSYAAKTEVFFDLEQRLGDGWAFLSKAQFSRLRYDSAGYTLCLPYDLGATTGACLPDQSTLSSYSRHIEAGVRGKFQTGSVQHTMLAGMSFRQTRLASYNDLEFPDVVDVPWPPSGMQLPPVATSKSVISSGDAIYSSNFFLQDQMKWRRWHMLVNVGYEQERNNFSFDVDRYGVERDTAPPRNSPVYNLGIAYRLSDRTTLYANTFRSFTPGNRVLDSTLNGGPPGTIVAPPTTGKSVELGLKLNLLDNRATFSAAIYRATHTNVLQPTAVLQTALSNVDYVLLSSTISRGVELNLAGRLMPGWNLTASYSYVAFQYAKPPGDDPQLSQFPRHRASLWSTYDFQADGWRGWGAGLGLIMRSGYAAYSENDNVVRLPGQTRTDASIYYKSRYGKTTLGIKNLFDRRLCSDFSGPTVGIEPGRALLLTNIFEF